MFPGLDDREQGFESNFSLRQEMIYRAFVRRNEIFAAWAARLMGRHAEGAETYRRALLKAVNGDSGVETLVRTVKSDLHRLGHEVSEERLYRMLEHAESRAWRDVLNHMLDERMPSQTEPEEGDGAVHLSEESLKILEGLQHRRDAIASRAPHLKFGDLFLAMVTRKDQGKPLLS